MGMLKIPQALGAGHATTLPRYMCMNVHVKRTTRAASHFESGAVAQAAHVCFRAAHDELQEEGALSIIRSCSRQAAACPL